MNPSATDRHRLASMLRWDVRLQVRYGFYAVYAVLTAVYVVGIRLAPEGLRPTLATLAVFGDPAFLGFYFVGAVVLFEKGDGVVEALATSPLRGSEYLASKALSLSLLATIASVAVVTFANGPSFRVGHLLAGVVLTSVLMVLVGFVAVARFDSLNAYFLTSLGYLVPTALPLLDFLGIASHPALYLVPTQASLVLLGGAFHPLAPWQTAYAVGYLLACIAVAAVLARRAYRVHVLHRDRTDAGSGVAVPDPTRRVDGRRLGPAATLALADLRNWLRDPLLAVVVGLPLYYALVGRLLVPLATDRLAPGFDLVPHYPLLVALFTFTAPLAYGFVTGFFVLEERDEGVLDALWTTPLTGRGYVAYRSVAVTLVSFVSMAAVPPAVGLVPVPPVLLVPVAAVGSLWGVGCALLLPAFSTNSVEGVAVSKFLGLSVLVPIAAIALVPGPLQFLAGAIPPYWPMKALLVGLDRATVPVVGRYLLIGLASHLAVVGWFVRRFEP